MLTPRPRPNCHAPLLGRCARFRLAGHPRQARQGGQLHPHLCCCGSGVAWGPRRWWRQRRGLGGARDRARYPAFRCSPGGVREMRFPVSGREYYSIRGAGRSREKSDARAKHQGSLHLRFGNVETKLPSLLRGPHVAELRFRPRCRISPRRRIVRIIGGLHCRRQVRPASLHRGTPLHLQGGGGGV